MKKYLLILFVMSLMVSACAPKSEDVSLLGSWKLISYGPTDAQTPAVPDAKAQLTFNEDGTVTGNSGCNGFGGTYTAEGDQVTFSDIVSTLMACDDPRMEQEGVVMQVLNGTVTFKIEGTTLTLTNNDMMLVFTK